MRNIDLRTEMLHLFVLTAFALAQPLFGVFKRDPAFFVLRRSEPIDIGLFVLVVSAAVPLAVGALMWLLRKLSPRRWKPEAGTLLHRIVVAAAVALIALPIIKRLAAVSGTLLIALAIIGGGMVAWRYHRSAILRTYLTFLSPTVLLFPALFVLDPAIRRQIFRAPQAVVDTAAPVADAPPVVWMVFDALPLSSLLDASGSIDARRYPNFARLAASSTWYRNGTSVSDDTTFALPAMLTGNLPDLSRLASFIDHPRSLFSLLGGSYRIRAHEAVTELCPPPHCARVREPATARWRSLASDAWVVWLHLLAPSDLADRLPSIADTWKGFGRDLAPPTDRGHDERVDRFRDFLEGFDPEAPPTLHFFHSLLPHTPYVLYPSLTRVTTRRKSVDGQGLQWAAWNQDLWSIRAHQRRHLLQLGAVDTLLGELLDRLEETGQFDRSLIVISADHGVSFRPGDDRRRLSKTNFADIMSVPILIKRPGQRAPEVDPRNVQTIDILPTIADLVGTDLPWPVDGISAADRETPRSEVKICRGEPEMRVDAGAFARARATAEGRIAETMAGDFDSLLRMGPHPELIGRRIEDLETAAGDDGLEASLLHPAALRKVDPASGFVPALIEGLLTVPEAPSERPTREGPPDEGPPDERMALAVALHGEIAATTWTFERPVNETTLAWSILVDESALRAGANPIEIFVIEGTPDSPRLARVAGRRGAVSWLDVRLGAAQLPTIRESGFYPPEVDPDGTRFRWTRQTATLVVPLPVKKRPETLRVELLGLRPNATRLTITVNREPVFTGQVPKGAWSETFEMPDKKLGRHATITLEATTFTPRQQIFGNPDSRKLGVAVAGIWLQP